VKALRVWLLLLLAVLLPVRGAVAAAMLCAPAGVGTQTEVRVIDRALGHHGSDTTGGGHHEHASHDHGTDDHGLSAQANAGDEDTQGDNASGGTADKCNVCSSFCSVTPMVSAVTTLPLPLLTASTVYPALGSPAIAFLSDGQDRPPRSI
jgi:hypothetical protein